MSVQNPYFSLVLCSYAIPTWVNVLTALPIWHMFLISVYILWYVVLFCLVYIFMGNLKALNQSLELRCICPSLASRGARYYRYIGILQYFPQRYYTAISTLDIDIWRYIWFIRKNCLNPYLIAVNSLERCWRSVIIGYEIKALSYETGYLRHCKFYGNYFNY